VGWELNPPEPLAESAPLAHAWSKEHCGPCGWYHGAWQYLRLAGTISGISAEAGFFQATLRGLARGGDHPRVLIAATADYGMLAQVIHAYRAEGATLELTILDRCETPLLLNRWYARRFAFEPRLQPGDVFEFEPDRPFDLVCTHSFFSFVDPARHAALVQCWHRLLRPGGCVVTSQSVRPGHASDSIRFTAEQAAAFGARAHRAAAGIDAPIRAIATRFAEQKSGHVLRDAEVLRSAFLDGGFQLERFAPADPASQREHRAASPGDRESSRRIQIVARR
jgi:SAM-dependent methyltransferase